MLSWYYSVPLTGPVLHFSLCNNLTTNQHFSLDTVEEDHDATLLRPLTRAMKTPSTLTPLLLPDVITSFMYVCQVAEHTWDGVY